MAAQEPFPIICFRLRSAPRAIQEAPKRYSEASASKIRFGPHFGPTFGPPKRPRAPEKSLESLQLSLKIKVLPFSAWIVFGPRFGTLLGFVLGAYLAPRHAETDLLGGLGPSKSRFQLLFWGPRRVQERSKRRPRGQRRPEQISRPPKWAPRSIWDQFGSHFGCQIELFFKDFKSRK